MRPLDGGLPFVGGGGRGRLASSGAVGRYLIDFPKSYINPLIRRILLNRVNSALGTDVGGSSTPGRFGGRRERRPAAACRR